MARARYLQSVICGAALILSTVLAANAQSAVLSFQASDFGLSPTFSNVQTFDFSIDISGSLVAGATYTNPNLNSVDYSVSGSLGSTPSGFSGFNLARTISNADFYSQGSSLSFSISALADLSNGLQVSELVSEGSAPVFVFNGREVGTGRYHPALVELYADGTGQIQNSNNLGGINPDSGNFVNVGFGEEYITDLTFDAATLTLVQTPTVVPIPTAAWLFGSALLGLAGVARQKKA